MTGGLEVRHELGHLASHAVEAIQSDIQQNVLEYMYRFPDDFAVQRRDLNCAKLTSAQAELKRTSPESVP